MKNQKPISKLLAMVATALFFLTASITSFGQTKPAVKNIVIVHGAFADASGWEAVYKILKKDGYKVTLVQNPLTSLEDDVAATNRALDKQDGPVILVGHSWGGAVITQAGVSPKVVGLVYVAAFVPDKGETVLGMIQNGPQLPVNGILPPDDKGIVYFDKLQSFIQEKVGAEVANGIDYMELRPFMIFSYYIYEQDKTVQYLLILTDQFETVLHEKLSEEREGIGRSTMILKASTLVYLKNNNEFSSLTLS